MTIHSSLRGVDTLRGERSVLTRIERLQKLAKDGKLDPEKDSVWGLPKVRTKFKVAGAKKAKAAAATAEGEGEGETPAAAEGEAEAKAEAKADKKSDKKKDRK